MLSKALAINIQYESNTDFAVWEAGCVFLLISFLFNQDGISNNTYNLYAPFWIFNSGEIVYPKITGKYYIILGRNFVHSTKIDHRERKKKRNKDYLNFQFKILVPLPSSKINLSLNNQLKKTEL